MMPCLCLAPSWFPQMPLNFSIFWALLWNSYDVVDSICSQSQVKPASGRKLEAFKGLVRAHVAHRPLLGVAQVWGFPSRQLPSTVPSLIPALFPWVGKPTLYWQGWDLSPGRPLLEPLICLWCSSWFRDCCRQLKMISLSVFSAAFPSSPQDPGETLKLKNYPHARNPHSLLVRGRWAPYAVYIKINGFPPWSTRAWIPGWPPFYLSSCSSGPLDEDVYVESTLAWKSPQQFLYELHLLGRQVVGRPAAPCGTSWRRQEKTIR